MLRSGAATNAIAPERHLRLASVQHGARWAGRDAYPAWSRVADEHERWLMFIHGHGETQRFLPRLRAGARQRDETLAELGVAYFLEARCGLRIRAWEPPGVDGRTGDCLAALPDGRSMFVEVKAPGWESEVEPEERRARLQKGKYVHAEAGSAAPWSSVWQAVKKAYSKLPADRPTMVVLLDDHFVSLNDWPPAAIEAALLAPPGLYHAEEGLFVSEKHERLGAIGILNVDFPTGHVDSRWRFRIFRNPRCLGSVAVPLAVPITQHSGGWS
jgi:hypothetical protein